MLVAGARPNFMKVAPIISAIKSFNRSAATFSDASVINYILVHTGQHYDIEMSEVFFNELEIPKPDINLEVGSASHAVQTAEIMKRFEPVLMKEKPNILIVVGDVNSTMACTLVASKIHYYNSNFEFQTKNLRPKPLIAHIEAGLRSFDRSMPEEINRIVTDSLSDLLFTPSPDADENLIREGIPREKIKRVGNIMIDTLVANLNKAKLRKTHNLFGLNEKEYVFVTLHRPNNVDDLNVLSLIMEKLMKFSYRIPVIFPAHPRTKKQIMNNGIFEEIKKYKNFKLLDPLGYLDTICLVNNSRFVLTDSGGLQEETTFLRIPCLTLRPNTERPITIREGTNKLTSLEILEQDFECILNEYNHIGKIPELWDGKTSERILKIILNIGKTIIT